MLNTLFETFNPIFLLFLSYGFGALATALLRKSNWFKWFENHNYIGDQCTKRLGILHLGWIIRKSFLGIFNKKLVYSGKMNNRKLKALKDEMTLSENSHLLAFISLQFLITYLFMIEIPMWQIISYTLLNIIFNLYLVLLQQYNKRRIDRLLQAI